MRILNTSTKIKQVDYSILKALQKAPSGMNS